MKGPIDFVIVGFSGDKFNGSILNELSHVVESKTIRLIALSFIRKDKDGNVTKLDIADLGDGYFIEFLDGLDLDNDLLTQEDIDETSELLENSTAAGILVIEHLWAKPLKKAILDANGVLIADGRIHPDANYELNQKGEK